MIVDLELTGTPSWPCAVLSGEVDLSNVDPLADRVEAAVTNAAMGLVLDLTGCTHLDSTGLRMIFRLARRLGDRQQSLRLVVPAGSVLNRVIDLSGVATVAEVLRHRPADPDAPGLPEDRA